MDSEEYIEAIRTGTERVEEIQRFTRIDNHCVADLVSGVQDTQNDYDDDPAPRPVSRIDLSNIIKRFHTRAGTLTKTVSEELSAFEAGAQILRVAHQPNFLPYRGLMGQFVLLNTTAKELQMQDTGNVTQLYFIVDHDTARNYRFRTAHFPDPTQNEGVAPISVTELINRKDTVMTAIDAPSSDTVNKWVKNIGDYATVHNSKLAPSHPLGIHPDTIDQRKEQLQTLLQTAQECARSMAEFNAIVLSRIVNGWWNLPTLFLPLSECRSLLRPHYQYMLRRWGKIRELAASTIELFEGKGFAFSTNLKARLDKVPFWYICPSCQSRNPVNNKSGNLDIESECCGCGVHLSRSFGTWTAPDLGAELDQITPRTILDDLLDMIGFNIDGGVGYQSSLEHVIIAHSLATQLGWTPPPELYWRPYGYDLTPTEVLADEALKGSTRPHIQNPERALETVFTGRATIGYNILFNGCQNLRDRLTAHFDSDTTVNKPLATRSQLQ
ncbi:hypothetical protein [Halorientalis persicus]|nr:hypothetical protein [Halorientalis persicus]